MPARAEAERRFHRRVVEIFYHGMEPEQSDFGAIRIASARDLIAHSNAPVEAVAAARLTLDLVERAWRKHELARVAALLDSYPLERLR